MSGRRIAVQALARQLGTLVARLRGRPTASTMPPDYAVIYEDQATGKIRACSKIGGDRRIETGPGRLLARTVVSSGTSITPTPGCVSAVSWALGAGGGGGGVSSAASQGAAGGGGGSGAWAMKRWTTIPASWTVAIGAGGTAGANTGGNGGTGGNTTISDGTTTVTAKGGLGGTGMATGTAAAFAAGGAGQLSTTGDENHAGCPGAPGQRVSGLLACSGAGGGPGGGVGKTAPAAGADATGFGGGGGGAMNQNGAGAAIGGVGAGGLIVLYEYA